MAVMKTKVRVTFRESTTVLAGVAVLPRLVLAILGFVVLHSVEASDAYSPRPSESVRSKWMLVTRNAIETLAVMEETDGTA